MQKKDDIKICKLCNVTIHENNLKIVGKSYFHYMCWEKVDGAINKMFEKDLRKQKRKNKIKALAISVVINFFVWWGVLVLLRMIITRGQ